MPRRRGKRRTKYFERQSFLPEIWIDLVCATTAGVIFANLKSHWKNLLQKNNASSLFCFYLTSFYYLWEKASAFAILFTPGRKKSCWLGLQFSLLPYLLFSMKYKDYKKVILVLFLFEFGYNNGEIQLLSRWVNN